MLDFKDIHKLINWYFQFFGQHNCYYNCWYCNAWDAQLIGK